MESDAKVGKIVVRITSQKLEKPKIAVRDRKTNRMNRMYEMV